MDEFGKNGEAVRIDELMPERYKEQDREMREQMGLSKRDSSLSWREQFRKDNAEMKEKRERTMRRLMAGSEEHFQRVEAERARQEFLAFQPYSSLEEVFAEWECRSGRSCEVKFLRPSNLAEWQSTIYRCATMVKVLKTLDQFIPQNIKQYRFHYIYKTFYKFTTHVFEYDPANYSFIVKTGAAFGNDQIDNKQMPALYENARAQLENLLQTMKSELPQTHFEKVFALYVYIKDKKTAH
ncbi:hypothetical protein [Hymenobacter koreensis]|uniref:Uncharacterized protein n=1 Tax=Hymenobacter koreensis TaxID=1084523 RepID=A0ABP8J684_9BACT